MLRSFWARGRKSAPFHLALSGLAPAQWSGRDYHSLCQEGYRQNPVAHRCVRLIAESCAAVGFRLDGEGPAYDRARSLLDAPNLDQTGPELMETFFGHLHMAGNAYLAMSEGPGGSLEIHTLRPDRVRVESDGRGWTTGWTYRVGSHTQSYQRDLVRGTSPVLHLKLFNPHDDHYGLPPLEAAARAVDIHNAGGVWTKALLDNGARPSGALVVTGRDGGEGYLSPDQFTRLKAQLEDMHTGPDNAGRPLLLEGGLDWKPMALSPADMDYLEARREAAREIALAFGVPPLLLGLPGDNTYANYKEANLAFYRQTVLPLARKTIRALQTWLRPYLGEEISLRLSEDSLSALADERASLWQRLGDADFLSREEKRMLAGVEGDHA
ncbi:phage portal protein [Woodsholea maritima]|uniref:phage portal protein n=1 Tax=Woodsholea maritima TaxID=240237 RepID=UPI000372FD2B|nr:phage portal protein [Woodsholea maritima]